MNDRHQIPPICGGCGSPVLLITHLPDGKYGCCSACLRLQEIETRADPAAQLCDNCAFRPGSPERADPWGWMRKTEAFEYGQLFYCHKGMKAELTSDGSLRYLPGADLATLKPCAGWLALQKARAAKQEVTAQCL